MIHRFLLTLTLGASIAGAQAAPAVGVCDYAHCALSIAPRITALDVVSGADEQRIASLSFLLPRRTDVFASDSIAQRHVVRAFTIRRVAASFTDIGAAVVM